MIAKLSVLLTASVFFGLNNLTEATKFIRDSHIKRQRFGIKDESKSATLDEKNESPSAAERELQFACPAPVTNYVEYVFVDLVGPNPEMVTENEIFVLETNFVDSYNGFTYEFCDSFFRKINMAILIPSYSALLPSVVVLEVECRGCSTTAAAFPLFDESGRRALESSSTTSSLHKERSLQTSDCACYSGLQPTGPQAPSKDTFVRSYDGVISVTKNLGGLMNIDGIGNLEMDEVVCNEQSLIQVVQTYLLRFAGETDLMEDSLLQTTFVSAFNKMRAEPCHPLAAFSTVTTRSQTQQGDETVRDITFEVISLQAPPSKDLFSEDAARDIFLWEYTSEMAYYNFSAQAIWVQLAGGLGAEIFSEAPSAEPTEVPSEEPSQEPSQEPSMEPSMGPSFLPSLGPSIEPSLEPSIMLSNSPSVVSSPAPSLIPSNPPSSVSSVPSDSPVAALSSVPSEMPSPGLSISPTVTSSTGPSMSSEKPSAQPSSFPSVSTGIPRITLPLREVDPVTGLNLDFSSNPPTAMPSPGTETSLGENTASNAPTAMPSPAPEPASNVPTTPAPTEEAELESAANLDDTFRFVTDSKTIEIASNVQSTPSPTTPVPETPLPTEATPTPTEAATAPSTTTPTPSTTTPTPSAPSEGTPAPSEGTLAREGCGVDSSGSVVDCEVSSGDTSGAEAADDTSFNATDANGEPTQISPETTPTPTTPTLPTPPTPEPTPEPNPRPTPRPSPEPNPEPTPEPTPKPNPRPTPRPNPPPTRRPNPPPTPRPNPPPTPRPAPQVPESASDDSGYSRWKDT